MLHIAGGSHNTAATALYGRMGFRAIPRDWVKEPNRDVWLMVDVMRWMRGADWVRVLGEGWEEVEERAGDSQGRALIQRQVSGLLTDGGGTSALEGSGEEENERDAGERA